MKTSNLIKIIIATLILISIKFYVGIYEDDEFSEQFLFIKHRPIWKTFFYSPRGMSDLELSDLSEEKRKEQILFDEFILGRYYE